MLAHQPLAYYHPFAPAGEVAHYAPPQPPSSTSSYSQSLFHHQQHQQQPRALQPQSLVPRARANHRPLPPRPPPLSSTSATWSPPRSSLSSSSSSLLPATMASTSLASCNLLPVVSYVLERIVAQNEQTKPPSELSVYHAVKAPSISLQEYLQRIVRYLKCGNEILVSSLIYIDLAVQRSRISITSLCVHRVLLTSVLLAIKFHDDHFYTNAYMAKVGGVTTKEMNRLELDFLKRVDFSLSINQSVYECYCAELTRHATAFQSAAAAAAAAASGTVVSPSIVAPAPNPAVAIAAAVAASNGTRASSSAMSIETTAVTTTVPVVMQPSQQLLHHQHLHQQQQQQQPIFQYQQHTVYYSQSAQVQPMITEAESAAAAYYAQQQQQQLRLQQQHQQQQQQAFIAGPPVAYEHHYVQQPFAGTSAAPYSTGPHHLTKHRSFPTKTSKAFYPQMATAYGQPASQPVYYSQAPPAPFYAAAGAAPAMHDMHDPMAVAENFAVSASQLRTACETCVSQEVYRKHLSPSLVDRAVTILDEEQRKNATHYDGSLSSHVLRDTCARLVQEQHLSPSLIRRANATLRSVACGY